MDNQKWVPIVGYEGLYEISNLGRIKTLRKVVQRQNKDKTVYVIRQQKILTGAKDSMGYRHVRLIKNGKDAKLYKIHYLVAVHFLGYKQMKNIDIHHADQNKQNNRADNLIILTRKQHRILHGKLLREKRDAERIKKYYQDQFQNFIDLD